MPIEVNSPPPVPENEAERITALKRYEILDTSPEEAFDRITRIAATYLNVPIVLVSLVDETRQWFKSHHGIDTEETPREIAFCAHTIMGDLPTVIEDATKDLRFVDNPLVTTDPNIRFYAGAPLITHDGFKLGTICAIDRQPRSLTMEQQNVLADLAGLVIDALELRLVGRKVSAEIVRNKQEANTLHRSTAFMQSVLDNVADGIITISQQGLIESLNHAGEQLFGYTSAEVKGKDFKLLMPEPFYSEYVGYMQDYARTGETVITGVSRELMGQRKDGSTFPMEVAVGTLQMDDQVLFTGIMRDITERKQIDQQLRDREAHISAIVNNAVDGIITIDEQGLVETFNHAAVTLFGYAVDEVIGHNIKMLMPSPYAAEHDGYLTNYRNSGEARIIGIGREVVGQRKNGSTFPMELSVAEVKLGDRRIFTGIVRDISERKQAEHELMIRQERLDFLLTANPACIYTSKASGDYAATFISDNVRTNFGLEPSQFLDDPKFWAGNIHPDDVGKVFHDLAQAVGQRESYNHEYRFRLNNGSYCWIYDELQTIFDDEGQPAEIIGSWRRIDDLKQAEQELISAKEVAEKANRAKSDFLSRMSHELRTPLNAILGFGQILEMEDLNSQDRESVDHIIKAGRHLTDLINEVLDIARIESGRQNLSPEPVHISSVLEDAWSLMRPLAAKRNIELKQTIPEECNAHVLADLQRLKQVLLNLMSNAVKYNHDGGTVMLFCTETREGIIRISISDTGPGIGIENRERIFEPFERLDADETDVQGSGIGLALSKALVEAMGGILKLDSDPGLGSTFWVELPLIDAATKKNTTSTVNYAMNEVDQSRPATLLYIEDNIANLRLIEVALSHRPHINLIAAMQGKLGIDLALQHKPDLILLDLHLPGLMGDQVLARLKSHSETQQIPVIIISADATKRQIKKLLAEGAYAYLTKPFNIKELIRTVDTALDLRADSNDNH